MLLSSLLTGSANLHKEAVDWHNRVLTNGGRVSNSTLKAVSNFCRRIEAANIRDKFYRLNLFCGNNTSSALVPLYRGPNFVGTQYGNTTDTMINFTTPDFSENNGFQASASGTGTATKYLTTGFLYNDLAGSYTNSHVSSEIKAIPGSTISTSQFVCGGLLNSNNATPQILQYRIMVGAPTTSGYNELTIIGGTNTITRTNQSIGTRRHVVAVRTAANAQQAYTNGGNQVTSGSTISTLISFKSTATFVLFAVLNAANSVSTASYLHILSNYSIGSSLSSTQVSDFYNAVSVLNNTIGRS